MCTRRVGKYTCMYVRNIWYEKVVVIGTPDVDGNFN